MQDYYMLYKGLGGVVKCGMRFCFLLMLAALGVLGGAVVLAAEREATVQNGKVEKQRVSDELQSKAQKKLSGMGIEPAQYAEKLREVIDCKSEEDKKLAKTLLLAGANPFTGKYNLKELTPKLNETLKHADVVKLIRMVSADAYESMESRMREVHATGKKLSALREQKERELKSLSAGGNEQEKNIAEAVLRELEAEIEINKNHASDLVRLALDAEMLCYWVEWVPGMYDKKLQETIDAANAYIESMNVASQEEDIDAARQRVKENEVTFNRLDRSLFVVADVERMRSGKNIVIEHQSRNVDYCGEWVSVMVPLTQKQMDDHKIVKKVYKGIHRDFFAPETNVTNPDEVVYFLRTVGLSFPKGASASYDAKKKTVTLHTVGPEHENMKKAVSKYKKITNKR
ncbi:MAG: hypothetical protein IKV82_09115 [Akkermansia sp.]|nr:hypothetical protein [Akkermansia sp.]